MNKKSRRKLSVFCVLCVFGIFILGYTYFQNHKKTLNGTNTNETQIKQVGSNKKKATKNKNTAQDKKNKESDVLTETGYTAYNAYNYNEAVDYENKALLANENNARAHVIKGIATCYSSITTQNFNSGMAEIDKALAINPNYGYARYNKALALELYGHYDEALMWYDKALQVENFVWSYYGKACIYGRKGDVANSVKYLRIAIQMQANVKGEARNQKDFNNVKNSKEFKELVD
ncbi:MAG: hypothetical protein PHX70_05100 [Clostridium sp.]|nr:hypothetical protein [Clostridium sp.]